MIWIPIWTAQCQHWLLRACVAWSRSPQIFSIFPTYFRSRGSHHYACAFPCPGQQAQMQPPLSCCTLVLYIVHLYCTLYTMPRSAGPDAATTELLSLAVCSSAQWSPHSSKPSSMLSRLDIKTQTLDPCIGDTQWVHHSHHSLMAEHFSFISSISRLEMKSGTKLAFNELLHDISVVEQIVKLFHSP